MHKLPRFHDSLLATVAGILVFFSRSVRGDEPDFERDVAPLIVRRCLECHSSVEAVRPFRPGGESGTMVSDFYPRVRQHVDKLAVIRSC